MNQKPIKPILQFFDINQIYNILFFGIFCGLFCFGIFYYLLKQMPYFQAMTIIFTCVAFSQWANGIQSQKEKEPFFKNLKKSFSINPYIFFSVAVGILLQLFAVHVANEWFHMHPMGISFWKFPIIAFFASFFIVEIRKWISIIFQR